MTQPRGTLQESETQRASRVQSYLANLELGLRAAGNGQISFNRAVLTFPPALKADIYLREAAEGRLDVFGFLSYATRAMPPGMNAGEMRRAAELVEGISGILIGRLGSRATETVVDCLTTLSGCSARFASLGPDAQVAEINQAIEISRTMGNALSTNNQEPLRILLTSSRLGVGAQEWAVNVREIVFDRSGRIRREIERRAEGDRMMRRALESYIGFSPQERAEISHWLESGGSLSSGTFNKLYTVVSGEVRGEARGILGGLGLDYSVALCRTVQDVTLQNIYDINRQLEAFRSRAGIA